MFTQEKIQEALTEFNIDNHFSEFILELKQLGISRNDVYITTGLSIYFDDKDFSVQIVADEYPLLNVNPISSFDKLRHALDVHQEGKTDFNTFCKQAADAGIEKWIVDLNAGHVSYLDMKGNEMIRENIKSL